MKVNESYAATLPAAENKYGVELLDGEKVLFAGKLSTWGDERDQSLGMNSVFTLTDRRIIADNGAGVWTIDLKEDASSVDIVRSGKWIFKTTCFAVNLKNSLTYNDGKSVLNGFHFYFDKQDEKTVEVLIANLFE